MAEFTVELRSIETAFYDAMRSYPIFDEDHRGELNGKIFRHYRYREIGFETVDMFVDRLSARMNEIMPTYNELYKTLALEYDPLLAVDMHSDTTSQLVSQATNDASSNSTDRTSGQSSQDSHGLTTNYEMPQSRLSGNEDYASSAAETTGTGSSTTSSDSSASATSESHGTSTADNAASTHQYGRGVPAQQLIAQYRDLIINVDLEIINELSDLFMSIWSANIPYGRGYDYLW